jgi:hypothetical protein
MAWDQVRHPNYEEWDLELLQEAREVVSGRKCSGSQGMVSTSMQNLSLAFWNYFN